MKFIFGYLKKHFGVMGIGLSIKIKKAPIAVPIKGPKTGINAVKAIMHETITA